MFASLEAAENRFEELEQKLTDPEVLSDAERYKSAVIEHSSLAETVQAYREYKRVKADLEEAKEILEQSQDPDFRALAQSEFETAREALGRLELQLKELLMPKDPNDEKNVIMEIRAGTGGEEAALFAAVLFRMYTKYAERKGWTVSVMDASETEIGGYKEIVFTVEGRGAYSRLKFESGVHRVQRVPTTESGGRIHTSAATVAVLPEADDVAIELNMNEVDVDTYRSGGAGGQHINKTESAIRLTHRPTGIVVTCQDQRSQLKNKEKAIRVLKARLVALYGGMRQNEIAEERRSQVGTGDRSERIRTYNYPQSRITDHRIDLTLYRLGDFLEGDLDGVIDALVTSDRAKRLSESGRPEEAAGDSGAAGAGTGEF